ncbi:uncharacterized protein LOC129793355 isoform X2 [Lutzomyia longipalpis]|uniref:uncharacterized protein LOC129793355 isoform X2 n=1 Tax=Lutzomyia longipalpis TaxID=7200 RepID=UPI002483F628|nr:uncharacterized protein LOC129793355 isoform X2 [Lutzomyia longipalpis]
MPVVCTKRNNVSCERECSAIIIDDHPPEKAPNHIYSFNTLEPTTVGVNKFLPQCENQSMDKSVDSIGSCSLDVDAESTDFSDTSGSFNLLTPSSAKDFPREFITRIHERSQCPPLQFRQQTSIVLDLQSGRVNTILSGERQQVIVEKPPSPEEEPKKPSYLNLACCVNGYSYLTTYDSKVRQNINKSREVSPIRPITVASLQTYSKLDSSGVKRLLLPTQVAMFKQSGDSVDSHKSLMSPEKRLFTQHMITTETNGTVGDTTDNAKHYRTTKYIHPMPSTQPLKMVMDNGGTQNQYKTGSIAQHVERLFGPGALAQGFHTNRRSMENGQMAVLTEKSMNSRNFFSPVIKVNNKEPIEKGSAQEIGSTMNADGMENLKELEIALPVLRHLRPEFREQLPICSSPRRYIPPARDNLSSTQLTNGKRNHLIERNHNNQTLFNGKQVLKAEEMPHKFFEEKIGDSEESMKEEDGPQKKNNKDGNYFLDVLAKDKTRILNLADKVDGYMELIDGKDDTEEIIGYLRAASGKARLLAAQKMKQFEGLCNSNLNQKPDEKFQTTSDDLQGFWDMVMLQVNHVDSLFDEIETLKSNNWKKAAKAAVPPQGAKLTKRPLSSKSNTSSEQSQTSKKSVAGTLAAQKREAQRQQLMELKRKNRMVLNQTQNSDSADITECKNMNKM